MSGFFNILKTYDRGFYTLDQAKQLVMREVDRLMFLGVHSSDNDRDKLGFFKIMWFFASQGDDAFFQYVMKSYEEFKNGKTA